MKPYVLTGGPGVGKTTVLELLASRGYAITPEAARMIIEEETIKGSDVLPWKNSEKFQEEVAQRQFQIEESLRTQTVPAGKQSKFSDRSIVDGYAYCVLGKVKVPEIIFRYGRNRYEQVFLLEPLDTYITDTIRGENKKLALEIHEEIEKAYIFFGYDLIRVPPVSPEKRVDFILERVVGPR